MLPFVISVACQVGNFNGADCDCEVSVTAGTVDTADGFLVHWGSSINQSWVPPCIGQEGAVNRLTHNLSNTAGGIFFNGACYMIEYYGGNPEGVDMAQTWHIFGDASVQLRTDTPQQMTVVHADSISRTASSFDVGVLGIANALVGLYADTTLVGSGYTDISGNVTIDLNNMPNPIDVLHITVTAYNKIPYLDSITIFPSDILELTSLVPSSVPGLAISPNPFSTNLDIRYQVTERQMQEVRSKKHDIFLKIYDVAGRTVKSFNLASGVLYPASTVTWDGDDDLGRKLPAGVYFVQFEANNYKQIEKTILLK